MTLILTVANSQGVHQSSDYQLTSQTRGTFVSDTAGSKQMEAQFRDFHVHLAFTGIAHGTAGPTIAWLATELKALPQNSTLQTICNSLARRCASQMKPYKAAGVLILVLAVATVGKPFRVATISNVEDWTEPKPRAKKGFDISIRTVRTPFHLINGYRGCVPPTERLRLKALARSTDKTAEQLCEALADINATAAKNSKGYVSAGCWVSSQVADGKLRRFAMRNVGDSCGAVRTLQGGFDVTEFIKENFRLKPDFKVIGAAGVMTGPEGGVPLPPPEGEPRQFFLSGSSIKGFLRSPSGEHCATIHITQLDDDATMRRNQSARGPFARIQLESNSRTVYADFPRPKFPWPQIGPAFAINGVPVDRGWEYSVGYWIENGVHHVEIPRCSRGIRNMAFLGDDDELVFALVSGATLTWRPTDPGPSTTLEAEMTWRTRPDGTRG